MAYLEMLAVGWICTAIGLIFIAAGAWLAAGQMVVGTMPRRGMGLRLVALGGILQLAGLAFQIASTIVM